MPSSNLPINSPGLDRYTKVLAKYLDTNIKVKRDDLIRHKAKDVALQFFDLTTGAIPSKETIKAAVISRGWQVSRKKGAWPLKKGEKRGSKGPLNRMRAGAIERRLKGRGSVATGWLPAVYRFGGAADAGKKRLAPVRNPRGRVVIEYPTSSQFRVTIANSTPGIAFVNTKFNIVAIGLNNASRDMIKYLRQKQQGGSGKDVGGGGLKVWQGSGSLR